MKKADFKTLLSKMPAGKKRWTYDNAAGYDLSVYTESKVYGFMFDSLYKTLHVTVYNMQQGDCLGDCLVLDVFILTPAQADNIHNLFLEQ